uniref:Uncharacterized protein n=1 Tax=Parascaris univalens TaxID=6257 RepID=A0A915ACL9_PARUN
MSRMKNAIVVVYVSKVYMHLLRLQSLHQSCILSRLVLRHSLHQPTYRRWVSPVLNAAILVVVSRPHSRRFQPNHHHVHRIPSLLLHRKRRPTPASFSPRRSYQSQFRSRLLPRIVMKEESWHVRRLAATDLVIKQAFILITAASLDVLDDQINQQYKCWHCNRILYFVVI